MSKFGNNNGNNRQGQPESQTSLNGFRLDSSQSSWLMDRLDALSEEDKIAMHQAQQQLDQQQNSDGRSVGENNVPPAAFLSSENGEQGGAHQHLSGDEGPQQGYQQNPPQQLQAGAQDDNDLLRQKIEQLEQKISNIGQADEAARGSVDDRGFQQDLPQNNQHRRSIEQVTHESGYQGGARDEDYEYSREHIEPRLTHDRSSEPEHGAEHYNQSSGYHHGDGGGYVDEQPHPSQRHERYGQPHGEPHQGYGGYPQQGSHDHQYAQDQYYPATLPETRDQQGLPQFLQPEQTNAKKPKLMGFVMGVLVVGVISGVSFSYFSEGVSDIVKSEFGAVPAKQPLKLSDSNSRVIGDTKKTPIESKVAVLAPTVLSEQFRVSKLIGKAGTDVAFDVELPTGDFPSSFVVVRDLPQWAQLSKGRFVNGAWIVSAADVGDLKVSVPEDRSGEFSFIMEYVYSADRDPLSRTVTALISPTEKQGDVDVVATEKSPETIKPPLETNPQANLSIDKVLEAKWLDRGTRLLRAGDVSAARLAFSHLAEQGSGRGALAMAMTYDPNHPSAKAVVGIVPDVARARFWYERAIALGFEGAREPLRLLEK